MAVARKTHTLTFYPLTETPNSTTKLVPVPTEGAGVEVAGQLTPVSAKAAFEAIGLELTNPYLFLCDVGPITSVPIKVNVAAEDEDGYSYVVVARPMLWTAIPAQSYAQVYLEQTEFRA